MLIYFDLKRYLSPKNIFDDALDIIDYRLFSMMLKITLIFIKAIISGTSLVLFKVFFNSLYIYFEQATRVRNEYGADKLNLNYKQFMLIYSRT